MSTTTQGAQPGRPAEALDLRPAWLHTMTRPELIEAAIWCQVDAEYLYRVSRIHRDAGRNWLATLMQDNAAHSAALVRAALARVYA